MLRIDGRSSKPIYEQIIDGIRENIIKGILKPGDRLPSIRELSDNIMTNPNTVSKAYQELERQKTIETIRGRGTFVAENFTPRLDEDKINLIHEQMKKIVMEAHYMGLNRNDVVKILNDTYKEMEGES